MERAACIVAVILMLIVVVLSCIQIIVLSDSFFYRQYERNDVFRKHK